jgi:hypothetical protein
MCGQGHADGYSMFHFVRTHDAPCVTTRDARAMPDDENFNAWETGIYHVDSGMPFCSRLMWPMVGVLAHRGNSRFHHMVLKRKQGVPSWHNHLHLSTGPLMILSLRRQESVWISLGHHRLLPKGCGRQDGLPTQKRVKGSLIHATQAGLRSL